MNKPKPILKQEENENTDWAQQLSSSSDKNSNRITALIDSHLGMLVKIIHLEKSVDDWLKGFYNKGYVR